MDGIRLLEQLIICVSLISLPPPTDLPPAYCLSSSSPDAVFQNERYGQRTPKGTVATNVHLAFTDWWTNRGPESW